MHTGTDTHRDTYIHIHTHTDLVDGEAHDQALPVRGENNLFGKEGGRGQRGVCMCVWAWVSGKRREGMGGG